MLTLLLSALAIPANAQAPAVQDALYIYRNDGGFNGFFFDEIERFVYSRIDTLGVEHDDYVVQEVVTADSIYRIPLSAIDSIGFVTPETVYKKDVAHTSESNMWNYVIESDTFTVIRLASNTPKELVPKVGDKLVTIHQSEALPAGFIGKVTNVSNDATGITVKCDFIDLTDVFDQYVAKVRSIDEDEASARNSGRRKASGEESTITTKELPFDHTIDLISPGAVIQYGQILASGKIAKTRVKGKHNIWNRSFYNLCSTGLYKDFQVRVETNYDIIPTLNASITARADIPLVFMAPIPIPGIPLGFLNCSGGVTFSITGGVNMTSTFNQKVICVQNLQENISLAHLDGFRNQKNDFHLQHYESNLKCDKVSGSCSGVMGGFLSAAVSIGPVNVLVLRLESGIRATMSADFKEEDYTKAIPHILGKDGDKDYNLTYNLLSREGSISAQPFISSKSLLGVGLPGVGGAFTTMELSFDLDKLYSWFPQAFKTKKWKVEGQLAPTFSATSLRFADNPSAPIAHAGVSGRTIFTTPVGFAAYYKESGKQCGNTVWNDKEYKSWYNWEDDYASNDNINNYTLQMPNFGGGKTVVVYPTYRLFGYDLLGAPTADVTVQAKLESTPKELPFDVSGGKETLTLIDNLDWEEDNYTVDYNITFDKIDEDYGPWLTLRKEDDKGVYTATADPNTSAYERTGTLSFNIYNKNKSINLTHNVPFSQKAPNNEFSISPETLKVAGYGKEFKDGWLTQMFTIVYPTENHGIKITSSDRSWLTVDESNESITMGEVNTTEAHKIHIKANTDLVASREAYITVAYTNKDDEVDYRTLTVKQEPMSIEVKLEPSKVPLLANGGEQLVSVKITPYDDIVASVIKEQKVTPKAEWIDATIEGNVITIVGEENPVYEPRTNYVTYTLTPTTGNPITLKLEITQEAQTATVLCDDYTPNPIILSGEGGDDNYVDVTFNCDNIQYIEELTTFISGWLEGGKIGSKSIRLFAPNPNTLGKRKSGNFKVKFRMIDGTVQEQSYIAYQDMATTPNQDGIKKIYFYAYTKAHADTDNWDDVDDGEWHWRTESVEMNSLFTKDNATFKTTVNGDDMHVDCTCKDQGFYGSTINATLSFDIINYNGGDASEAKITNVKYASDLKYSAGAYGYMYKKQTINVNNIPVWNLSPFYIASVGTVADGVQFSNFSDVTELPDGTEHCFYDHDSENKALLRISFEGNDDDDWKDVIEDDDDYSRSTEKQARQKRVHSALERRLLQQLKKIKKQ